MSSLQVSVLAHTGFCKFYSWRLWWKSQEVGENSSAGLRLQWEHSFLFTELKKNLKFWELPGHPSVKVHQKKEAACHSSWTSTPDAHRSQAAQETLVSCWFSGSGWEWPTKGTEISYGCSRTFCRKSKFPVAIIWPVVNFPAIREDRLWIVFDSRCREAEVQRPIQFYGSGPKPELELIS